MLGQYESYFSFSSKIHEKVQDFHEKTHKINVKTHKTANMNLKINEKCWDSTSHTSANPLKP